MTDETGPQHPRWHYLVWGLVLLLAVGYGCWHWWDSRREAEAQTIAETRVVELVRASNSSFLQTATDHQIVSDAYGSCAGSDSGQDSTVSIFGGIDGPDEDPAKARSDSTVLPLHEPSSNMLAWRALVADAAKQTGLCGFADN
jgi:hypothetical protein